MGLRYFVNGKRRVEGQIRAAQKRSRRLRFAAPQPVPLSAPDKRERRAQRKLQKKLEKKQAKGDKRLQLLHRMDVEEEEE